jgi:hypothetical protein
LTIFREVTTIKIEQTFGKEWKRGMWDEGKANRTTKNYSRKQRSGTVPGKGT